MPTTALIGSIFLSITEGQSGLREATPGTLFGFTSWLFFSIVYTRLRFVFSVRISFAVGLLIWSCSACVAGLLSVSDLLIACLSYVSVAAVTLPMYRSWDVAYSSQSAKLRMRSLLNRGLLAGFAVVCVLITARLLGPFWGGVVAGAPVLWTFNVIGLERDHGRAFAASFNQTSVLGGLSSVGYVLVVGLAAPYYTLAATVACGLAAALAISYCVYRLTPDTFGEAGIARQIIH